MSSKNRGGGRPPRDRNGALLVVGLILMAAGMRAPLTGVGSLVPLIRADTGISGVMAGALTTLPLLTFAALSPLAPGLGSRFGPAKVLFCALLAETGGLVLRSAPPLWALFSGTVCVGLAVAIFNVLLPALIKRDLPERAGLMTGAYTTSMGLLAAISSGVSVPIAQRAELGWRASLGCWALLSVVAAAAWLPQLRADRRRRGPSAGQAHPYRGLWRSSLAWQVTMFMGLQSVVFYAVVAWLPEILRAEGMDAATAGWMLSLYQLVGLPATFLVPALAGRRRSQRGIVVATVSPVAVGILGLLFVGGTATSAFWVVLMGLGGGSFISLAFVLFSLRAPDPRSTAALSGMAQSVGYLLAAVGPVLFGYLHDLTRSWSVPLALLFVVTVGLLVAGLGAGRDRQLAPEAPPSVEGRDG